MIPLFLHLPKTGGTSFNNCICSQYKATPGTSEDGVDPYFQLGIYYFPHGFYQKGEDSFPPQTRTILGRDDLRAVVGHFPYGIHEHLPPGSEYSYLTFLRHPVDRIVSLYRHLTHFEEPDPALHREVSENGLTLREFAATFPLAELGNDQVRRIAGASGPCTDETLALARRRLRDNFGFVGLTEHFDESLLLIKHRFEWTEPLQYYRANVTVEWHPEPEPIDAETIDVIVARNRYDLELHAFARELFQEALAVEADPQFDAELAAFREHNRQMNEQWREGSTTRD